MELVKLHRSGVSKGVCGSHSFAVATPALEQRWQSRNGRGSVKEEVVRDQKEGLQFVENVLGKTGKFFRIIRVFGGIERLERDCPHRAAPLRNDVFKA